MLEQLYLNSPILFQNMAASTYGAILFNRRFMGDHDSFLERLRTTQRFSAEQLQALQTEELRKLLSYAFARVPYYRDMARENGLKSEKFDDIADLKNIPLLEPEYIRQNPETLQTEDPSRKGSFILKTSGTTGKPLAFLCNKHDRQRHYAFWTRLREWFGIRKRAPRASFWGRLIVPKEQKSPPFWRRDVVGNNYLFSVYHLSTNNMGAYYDKINAVRPHEIVGYAWCLYALAKYMKENRLRWSKPPLAAISSAETLLPHQREIIEEQFACRVVDQYGCTEMAAFISECEEGTYHVHPEHGIVEVVDSNGDPVPAGTPGEVACTSFVNYAFPLIRYKLGDRIVLGDEKCKCGRNFPVITELVGRVDDTLVMPDGTAIGRLSPAFKGIPGLCETQVIQTARDLLEVRVVTDADFSHESEKKLVDQLRDRIGDEIRINLERVDSIPREANGKFKAVKSMIG